MTQRPLDCEEAFRRLDDYVDRELSAEEIAAVEEHLAVCHQCSGEFTVERELLDGIRAKLGRLRVPPGLLARISARLSSD